MQMTKGVPMSGENKLILAVVGATIAVVFGAVVYFGNQKSAPKREELGIASMAVDRKSADLGKMKVSDEKSATFTISNTGNSMLRIWNINTSCDCTFATVAIGKIVSPEFNMAGMMSTEKTNWLGEVPAGQKATLTVIYRPSVMPVQGPITRQVNFSTNDPKNENVQLSIAASVL